MLKFIPEIIKVNYLYRWIYVWVSLKYPRPRSVSLLLSAQEWEKKYGLPIASMSEEEAVRTGLWIMYRTLAIDRAREIYSALKDLGLPVPELQLVHVEDFNREDFQKVCDSYNDVQRFLFAVGSLTRDSDLEPDIDMIEFRRVLQKISASINRRNFSIVES